MGMMCGLIIVLFVRRVKMTLKIRPQDTDKVAIKKFKDLWEYIFVNESFDSTVWVDLLYSRGELRRRGYRIKVTQVPLVIHVNNER
jgi:hypothetical protein